MNASPPFSVGATILLLGLLSSISDHSRAQSPDPPALDIERIGARRIQLSWPAGAAEFSLEESEELIAWLPSLLLPEQNGGRFQVVFDVEAARRFFRLRRSEGSGVFSLVTHLPSNGAGEVGLTFKPQIVFSRPVDKSTLAGAIQARVGGRVLATTVVPSNDGAFAWLFFDDPLPGSSKVRIVVEGDNILAEGADTALDADGDGEPGGRLEFQFTTVAGTGLPGTAITGVVASTGVDLIPGTPEDTDPGPDGEPGTEDDVFLQPIAGAEVFVLGRDAQKVVTAADGTFVLDAVPAGSVKLAVNGMTATNAPPDSYFPEITFDVHVVSGQENVVMPPGRGVFLTPLSDQILATVDAASGRTLTGDAANAPELSPEQRELLRIEIPKDSMIGSNGLPLASAEIGFRTVPTEFVRDMLPPGVMQSGSLFNITLQALGVARFSEPVPVSFPNADNLAPGEQVYFISFDHDTGQLVIEGTMTVSADGLSITTDPGVGITHPGWHGATTLGAAVAGFHPHCLDFVRRLFTMGTGIIDSPEGLIQPVPVFRQQAGLTGPERPLSGHLFPRDYDPSRPDALRIVLRNAALLPAPSEDPCSPANRRALPMEVVVKFDSYQPAVLFVPELYTSPDTFMPELRRMVEDGLAPRWARKELHLVIHPGNQHPLDVFPVQIEEFSRSLEPGIREFVRQFESDPIHGLPIHTDDAPLVPVFHPRLEYLADALFATKITLCAFAPSDNGPVKIAEEEVYLYRYLDICDESSTDAEMTFPRTLADGPGEVRSRRRIAFYGEADALPVVAVVDPQGTEAFDVRADISDLLGLHFDVDFDPPTRRSFDQAALDFFTPTGLRVDQSVTLSGQGTRKAQIFIDTGSLSDALSALFQAPPAGMAGSDLALIDTMQKRDSIAQAVRDRVVSLFQDPPNRVDHFRTLAYGIDFLARDNPADPELVQVRFANTQDPSALAGSEVGFATGPEILFWTRFQEAPWDDHASLQALLDRPGALCPDSTEFSLIQALNIRLFESLSIFPNNHFLFRGDGKTFLEGGENELVNILAATTAREIAYSLGALSTARPGFPGVPGAQVVTDAELDPGDVLGSNDLMAFGTLDRLGERRFQNETSGNSLRMGLAMANTLERAFGLRGTEAALGLVELTTELRPGVGSLGRWTATFVESDGDVELRGTDRLTGAGTEEDFGVHTVDGEGGASHLWQFPVENRCTTSITIDELIPRSSENVKLTVQEPSSFPLVLLPGELTDVTVSIDPLVSGDYVVAIQFVGDFVGSGGLQTARGTARSPEPELKADVFQSSFRHTIGDDASNAHLLDLVNTGSDTVRITDLRVEPPDAVHVSLKLDPEVLLNGLAPQEETGLELEFTVGSEGEHDYVLLISTDAAASPEIRVPFTVAGVPEAGVPSTVDIGNDFVVIETEDVILRTVSDDAGDYSFFLAADTPYRYAVYDPVANMLARGSGISGSSGQQTVLPFLSWLPSFAGDLDGDGLPGDAEFVIGTSDVNPDSNGDGVGDGAAVRSGSDPLEGTGLFSSASVLPLSAPARGVAVGGVLGDGFQQHAYLALGSSGLGIVDVRLPNRPIVLSELALPGEARDVAYDVGRDLAVVAGGEAGIHLVDVSDRLEPELALSVPTTFPADHVVTREGVAYVATGNVVSALDLDLREILDSVDVGSDITDLSTGRDGLFAMDRANVLSSLEVDATGIRLRDSLPMSAGGGRIAVGDGTIYVAATQRVLGGGGFSTVDASDPSSLLLISPPDNPSGQRLPGRFVLSDGSETLLLAGNAGLGPVLNLMDVGDPEITDSFLSGVGLEADPNDVALAFGLVFMASDEGLVIRDSGLLARDPASGIGGSSVGFDGVRLDASDADVDPSTPGVQVVGGTTFSAIATVPPDRAVRLMELFVDGELRHLRPSFPFHLSVSAPPFDPLASNRITLQAQASNPFLSGRSNSVTVEIVPDTFPPQVAAINPVDGGLIKEGPASIEVLFDEALAPASTAAFQVRAVGGSVIALGAVECRDEDAVVDLGQDLFVCQCRLPLPGLVGANIHDLPTAQRPRCPWLLVCSNGASNPPPCPR